MKPAVTVDSDHEEAAAICAEFRARELYPALRAAGARLEECAGVDANRVRVRAFLEGDVGWLTGSGHGFDERFTGQNGESILEVGQYDPAEVRGRIVHLLACSVGRILGPDLIANGCAAFIGYDEIFVFPPVFTDFFLECDAEIDVALNEGDTAGEAFDRARRLFTARILFLRNHGQPFAAQVLAFGRQHLVLLGDPDARLA